MYTIVDLDLDQFQEMIRFLLANSIHFRGYPRGECWEIILLGGF